MRTILERSPVATPAQLNAEVARCLKHGVRDGQEVPFLPRAFLVAVAVEVAVGHEIDGVPGEVLGLHRAGLASTEVLTLLLDGPHALDDGEVDFGDGNGGLDDRLQLRMHADQAVLAAHGKCERHR